MSRANLSHARTSGHRTSGVVINPPTLQGFIRRPSPMSPRAVQRVGLRTMLPSGPRWPLLHSVLRGGISLLSGLPPQRRPHADTDASPRPSAPEIRARDRADAGHGAVGDQLLAGSWILSGSYASSVFHMASTMAAMLRATVSLARLGLVPFSSCRS